MLDRLRDMIVDCTKCSTVVPPGIPPQGPIRAGIIVCGRNPGSVENRNGGPFDEGAPGGRLLNQELERIGVHRSELWVTNMVCCYTMKDREPTKEEIATCWPYLAVQIKFLRPWLVVSLGKQATNTIAGEGLNWADVRHRPRKVIRRLGGEDASFILLPTTHPGQALRGARSALYEDFNVLKQIVELRQKRAVSRSG